MCIDTSARWLYCRSTVVLPRKFLATRSRSRFSILTRADV